jgi:uncharacterized protein (TIGR02145 family)
MKNTSTIKEIAKTLKTIQIKGIKLQEVKASIVSVMPYTGTGKYIIDSNGYIGAILPDPNPYSFCHDKAICIYNADFSTQGLGKISIVTNGGDTIGGKKYRTVKIGNQIWAAENLDYKIEGFQIATDENPMESQPPFSYPQNDIPACRYYNKNEQYASPYGLLYNGAAVQYIIDNAESICPGWHVPTYDDMVELFNFISEDVNIKLAATSTWNTPFGEDTYGFSAVANGFFAGSYTQMGDLCKLYIDSSTSQVTLGPGTVSLSGPGLSDMYCGVRLIKNA